MKTLAIALLAALSLTSACATDADYPDGERGLRPGFKPSLDPNTPEEVGGSSQIRPDSDRPDINESFDINQPGSRDLGVDDGRVVWATDVLIDSVVFTELHQLDLSTGIDSIQILDENGVVRRIVSTRYDATKIDVSGSK